MLLVKRILPADDVVVVHDGAEALDYLYGRGPYAVRAHPDPAVIFLDLKSQ
jgi:hypothetical protein